MHFVKGKNLYKRRLNGSPRKEKEEHIKDKKTRSSFGSNLLALHGQGNDIET